MCLINRHFITSTIFINSTEDMNGNLLSCSVINHLGWCRMRSEAITHWVLKRLG